MAQDIPQICAQVVQALDLILNPVSDSAKRNEATKFVQQVERRVDAMQVSNHLCNAPDFQAMPPVRQFGYKMLKKVIRERWNDWMEGDKADVKKFCINTLAIPQGVEVPFFIKAKFIECLVEVARR